MINFLSGIKAVVQLVLLLRSVWSEWTKYQREKEQFERQAKADERARVQKELQRVDLTLEEKRKLLADLTNNLPY